jgi:hypothetical protein
MKRTNRTYYFTTRAGRAFTKGHNERQRERSEFRRTMDLVATVGVANRVISRAEVREALKSKDITPSDRTLHRLLNWAVECGYLHHFGHKYVPTPKGRNFVDFAERLHYQLLLDERRRGKRA